MMCMGEALRTIAFKVRTASCGGTACVNSFGDEQLAVDMLADKLLFEVRLINVLSKFHFLLRKTASSHFMFPKTSHRSKNKSNGKRKGIG